MHLCPAAVCSYWDLTDDLGAPQTGLAEDARVYLINRAAPNKRDGASKHLLRQIVRGCLSSGLTGRQLRSGFGGK